MGVSVKQKKEAKHKNGGAKYRVESGRKTELYRDESGKLMRRETRYRRIVRKDGGGLNGTDGCYRGIPGNPRRKARVSG